MSDVSVSAVPAVSLTHHPVCLGDNPPTNRQLEIAEFIVGFTILHGYCPALQDICDHYGWNSKNGPVGHISLMREKKLVEGDRLTSKGDKKASRGLVVSGYAYGDLWEANKQLTAKVAELQAELAAKTAPVVIPEVAEVVETVIPPVPPVKKTRGKRK